MRQNPSEIISRTARQHMPTFYGTEGSLPLSKVPATVHSLLACKSQYGIHRGVQCIILTNNPVLTA